MNRNILISLAGLMGMVSKTSLPSQSNLLKIKPSIKPTRSKNTAFTKGKRSKSLRVRANRQKKGK